MLQSKSESLGYAKSMLWMELGDSSEARQSECFVICAYNQ
jgi:hypothetical protein